MFIISSIDFVCIARKAAFRIPITFMAHPMTDEKRRPLINVLCEIRRIVTRKNGVAKPTAELFQHEMIFLSLHRWPNDVEHSAI
jgi:hypothetical protein